MAKLLMSFMRSYDPEAGHRAYGHTSNYLLGEATESDHPRHGES
jgi:hypothetical protein